jgi:hypothetical protein
MGLRVRPRFRKKLRYLETSSFTHCKEFRIDQSVKKVIGELRFPGLTLKTVLNWNFYWNKCTLYIKIQTVLKHYYMYSPLFIEITQSV